MKLETAFTRHMLDLHGERGRRWLEDLPRSIAALSERWELDVGPPRTELTYNYIAPARLADGTGAMLKLGVPGLAVEREAMCLRSYDGLGAARVLAYDAGLGALLLELVRPGIDLRPLPEEQAVAAAVSVMQLLHRVPLPGELIPGVQDWGRGFQRLRDRYGGSCGPLPARLVDEAETVYAGLAGSMQPPALLHGDLHHLNILSSDRMPFLAIDPQGVLGEPAYEVGAFLYNPLPEIPMWPALGRILERRVAMFSERLDVERRRIAGWGFSRAVLSGIWSLEDHGAGWDGALRVAGLLRPLAVV